MEIRMIDGFGWDGSIIREAAMNCYGLIDSSRDEGGYIRMLKKNKHTAMLEFSWFPVLVEGDNVFFYLLEMFNNSYIKVNKTPEGTCILVGNGRAWWEWFNYMESDPDFEFIQYGMYSKILFKLAEVSPELFRDKLDIFEEKNVIPTELDIFIEPFNLSLSYPWFCFKIEGVSRNLTHQLVRHRTLSFAQVSTRYVKYNNKHFIYPDLSGELYKEMEECVDISMNTYSKLLEAGVKKDDARQILPSGIESTIYAAGPIEAWDHFLYLRTKPESHWEIRQLAGIIEEKIYMGVGYGPG